MAIQAASGVRKCPDCSHVSRIAASANSSEDRHPRLAVDANQFSRLAKRPQVLSGLRSVVKVLVANQFACRITVGPPCRGGLSPQGEPPERTSAQQRHVILQPTGTGRRSRRVAKSFPAVEPAFLIPSGETMTLKLCERFVNPEGDIHFGERGTSVP
jgi:hypothetical protein